MFTQKYVASYRVRTKISESRSEQEMCAPVLVPLLLSTTEYWVRLHRKMNEGAVRPNTT